MSVKDLLGRGTFMMSLALIVALSMGLSGYFPEISPDLRSNLTIFILAVMMTVSLSRIPYKGLNPADDPKSVLKAVILSMVVASSIPLAASLFFTDEAFKVGLVFIGLTPFAASVVPLSYILRGDMKHAARGAIAVYFLSVIYIPFMVWLMLDKIIDVTGVIIAVAQVVVVPLFLSRLLVKIEIKKENLAIFLNSCIFILVFLSVGASANMFRSEVLLLVTFMGIAALRTFGLGLGLEIMERRAGVPWEQRVTDVLMTSYKNKGIAIALVTAVAASAALAPGKALFPVTASIVVEICWVIFMDAYLFSPKRMKRELEREGRGSEVA